MRQARMLRRSKRRPNSSRSKELRAYHSPQYKVHTLMTPYDSTLPLQQLPLPLPMLRSLSLLLPMPQTCMDPIEVYT